MAVQSTYYLDAPSLGSASVIYSDAGLTTVSADGFYSDGIIVREQVSGVLLPQQTCSSCEPACGTTISASGGQGIYLVNLGTGSDTLDVGAIIIRFDPISAPDGIRATLGTTVYNKLVSSVDGLHQSPLGSFTYVGQTSGDCGISGTTYPAVPEFNFDGTSFVPTGNTQSIFVAPLSVSLGASAPGNMLMVVPKLTPTPSVINIEVVGPCIGTAWDLSVNCPVLLTGFSSSAMAASSIAACALELTQTYYNASLYDTPGIVGLYDLVFSDAYGNTQLPAGFYFAEGSVADTNDWFEVDTNGVVISLGTCITCYEWTITNNTPGQVGANWVDCCSGSAASELIDTGNAITVCSRTEPTSGGGTITGGTVECQSSCG
jgi:hypothetical protein